MNKNNELLDLAYAKLHALKMASISENDVATKFKLNRQIEELEKSTGLKEKGLEKIFHSCRNRRRNWWGELRN